MAQIDPLITATKALVESSSKVIGVSAANINLVAVAGTLYSMQVSGYEIISSQMFQSNDLGPSDLLLNAGDSESQGQPMTDVNLDNSIYSNLIETNLFLNPAEFAPIEFPYTDEYTGSSQFSNLILSEESLFNPDEQNFPDTSYINSPQSKEEYSLDKEKASVQSDDLSGSDSQAETTKPQGINSSAGALPSNGGYVTKTVASSQSISPSLNEPNGSVIFNQNNQENVFGTNYADTIYGSPNGNDSLNGGSGNDTYIISSSSSKIIENANGGNDTALIGVNNYLETDNIETIIALDNDVYREYALTNGPYLNGIDSGWKINGTNISQTLIGSTGADILRGGGGFDLLVGGLGDDLYEYSGAETIIENSQAGRDIVRTNTNLILPTNTEVGLADTSSGDLNLFGNDSDNLLIGNIFANSLSGGLGNDTLIGNGGEDIFSGGAGQDVFVLNGFENYLGDIRDFEFGGDRIQISYSNPTITLSLSSESEFTGVAGQVLIGEGMVQFDWNGDSQSDALLLINEAPRLTDISIIDPANINLF